MVKIGNVDIQGPLVLAPMAGVTDAPFRALCRAQGAALTCTEMVSAKALVYHDEKTKQLLWSPPDEHPAAAQIFGHEPEVMAEAAPMALEYSGADILDINMGCPVGKVIRSGDGSALMRDPELAGRVIEAVVNVLVKDREEKKVDAGQPAAASDVLYSDISADDANTQTAARWAVESGLIPLPDEADGTRFAPDAHVSRITIIKAWNKAQELKQSLTH